MESPTCQVHHAPLPDEHAGHDHGGHHRPRQRRALLICLALTFVTMFAEIVGGWWTGSLMLYSDAAHMLSHAVALGISYVAIRLASRAGGARSHFGHYRAEILGAFLNGLGLIAFTVWIVVEAIDRLAHPVEVMGREMMAVALLGLVVNLLTAWILMRAGAHDLNTRSALLHMLGDTLSSVAIVLGGVVLVATGWSWIDPSLSILVAIVILIWGIGLLRQSTSILLEFAPAHVPPQEVRDALLGLPEVEDVHDLHVWEITSGYVCLTAHLVVADGPLSEIQRIQDQAGQLVRKRFRVGHATLQMECRPPSTALAGSAPP